MDAYSSFIKEAARFQSQVIADLLRARASQIPTTGRLGEVSAGLRKTFGRDASRGSLAESAYRHQNHTVAINQAQAQGKILTPEEGVEHLFHGKPTQPIPGVGKVTKQVPGPATEAPQTPPGNTRQIPNPSTEAPQTPHGGIHQTPNPSAGSPPTPPNNTRRNLLLGGAAVGAAGVAAYKLTRPADQEKAAAATVGIQHDGKPVHFHVVRADDHPTHRLDDARYFGSVSHDGKAIGHVYAHQSGDMAGLKHLAENDPGQYMALVQSALKHKSPDPFVDGLKQAASEQDKKPFHPVGAAVGAVGGAAASAAAAHHALPTGFKGREQEVSHLKFLIDRLDGNSRHVGALKSKLDGVVHGGEEFLKNRNLLRGKALPIAAAVGALYGSRVGNDVGNFIAPQRGQ
jgi:hypothetical protein